MKIFKLANEFLKVDISNPDKISFQEMECLANEFDQAAQTLRSGFLPSPEDIVFDIPVELEGPKTPFEEACINISYKLAEIESILGQLYPTFAHVDRELVLSQECVDKFTKITRLMNLAMSKYTQLVELQE